nr:hypothetical protein [candidate division Zixibacteria bacterium]NIT55583.1 hypothetical protein [Fodinibius sp.]NIU13070.1 hypothetical protein [candidate division Zixibacteria bacterium]NIV05132.1 hypothetical protein [candidate division Zixibacteria bacterium]NIY24167.1 hypothetical protein [Fodinibius sp.]
MAADRWILNMNEIMDWMDENDLTISDMILGEISTEIITTGQEEPESDEQEFSEDK